MSSHPLPGHSRATALDPYLRPAAPVANAGAPLPVFTLDALRRCSDGEVYDFIASGPAVEEVADALTASLLDSQRTNRAWDYFFDLMACLDDSPRLDEVWGALMTVIVDTRQTLARLDVTYSDDDVLHACGPTTPVLSLSWGLLECMMDHANGEFPWDLPANLELVATTAALATTFLDTAIELMAESFASSPTTGAATGITES